jgi:PD-(D/E)XK nuclease superfamily protein
MAYPKDALHPKIVGDQTQAMVLGRLVQAFPYAQMWIPFGENTRADLVIELDGRFIRVQCKTGRLRKGAVSFSTCSHTYHHPSNRGTRTYQHHYRGQADLFGVYCPETDGVYLVPVDEVGTTHGSLRVEPTQNNQVKKIRWARDYEVSAGLAQLVEQGFCKAQAVGSSPTPGSRFPNYSNQPRLPMEHS